MSWSAIALASRTGMAKPIPMLPAWPLPWDSEAMAELMPTSWPEALTRAPPLLPGLIAALVWIALVTTGSVVCCDCPNGSVGSCWLCPPVVTGRLRALTIPVVTVPARPSGLPMAMTGSPTLSASESPTATGVRPDGGEVRRTTARSVEGSVPRMVPLSDRPSVSVTVTAVAPSTTWLLVRMLPALSRMTPEPWVWPSEGSTVMATTLGDTAAAVAVQFGACGSAWTTGAELVPRPGVDEDCAMEGFCASVESIRVAAYVPPLASRAASNATVVSSTVRRALPGWAGSVRTGAGAGAYGPAGSSWVECTSYAVLLGWCVASPHQSG